MKYSMSTVVMGALYFSGLSCSLLCRPLPQEARYYSRVCAIQVTIGWRCRFGVPLFYIVACLGTICLIYCLIILFPLVLYSVTDELTCSDISVDTLTQCTVIHYSFLTSVTFQPTFHTVDDDAFIYSTFHFLDQ